MAFAYALYSVGSLMVIWLHEAGSPEAPGAPCPCGCAGAWPPVACAKAGRETIAPEYIPANTTDAVTSFFIQRSWENTWFQKPTLEAAVSPTDLRRAGVSSVGALGNSSPVTSPSF